VLEAIFDKGYEEEGLYEDAGGNAFYGESDIGFIAYPFDVDVIADKFYLLVQGYFFFVAFIDKIAHNIGQLDHYLGCPFGLLQAQGIDTVQGIKKEMGVKLCSKVAEFVEIAFPPGGFQELAFVDGFTDIEDGHGEAHIEDGPGKFPQDGSGGKGKIGSFPGAQVEFQNKKMDCEKKGLDDEEGENGHQDGEAAPVLGKKYGAHDAGIEEVAREKQEADEQQHGPYPWIAQEESGDIDKGVDENEETPIEYFSFVGAPAEPVIIVFHGLRIMP